MNNRQVALHPPFGPSRGQLGIHYSRFTDSGSEASSARHGLVCTIHQLSEFRGIPYYSSSWPLYLLIADRLLAFRLGLLPNKLSYETYEALDRSHQSISREDHK